MSATGPPVDRTCWCGGGEAHPAGVFALKDSKTFSLVRCEACGVYALYPQPDDDELLSYYSSEYYGESRRKFIGPVAWIVNWFQGHRARLAARWTPPAGRVLDVGCGNGGFLIQMQQRGYQVEGTEWTAASAARVPAEAGIPIHVGDLLDLGLPDQSYDLVTLWHVLEHLRDPHRTLARINRLLKPGGRLILSLPNAESRQAERFGTAWFHHDPPRHLFGFGPKSLKKLLALTGFQLHSSSTFSLEQNPFGYIQSALNARGLPRDRLYSKLKSLNREPGSFVDSMNMALLLCPALITSTWESTIGRGATMTIVARKERAVGA